MAALLSIELSNYKSQYLCVKESKKQEAKIFDHDVFRFCETDNCLNWDQQGGDKNNNVRSRNGRCQCSRDAKKNNGKKDSGGESVPFLYSFYSTTPFRSLFLPCPLVSSGLPLHKTHSYTELNKQSSVEGSTVTNMISSTVTHLNALASAVSSSLSNIWKPSSFEVRAEQQQQQHDEVESKCTSDNHTAMSSSVNDSVVLVDDDSPPSARGVVEFDSDGHEVITTRMRLPSIRMFGSDHAVDIDCDAGDIDAFESTVTQEFTNDLFDNDDDTALLNSQLQHPLEYCGGSNNCEDVSVEQEDRSELEGGGYSLTHLTFDMFSSVVQNYNECKDTSFLINTIRTVFSSWESLEMSFSNEGSVTVVRNTVYPFDMNFEDVSRVFSTIMQMEIRDVVIGVLMDTVKIMLLSRSYSINEAADVKPLIIVLEIPW